MAVPPSELRILFQKSGNRCAFPKCRRVLTAEGTAEDDPVVLGEVAHIVAERPDGPRGDSPLTLKERNKYENLILLCHLHHQLVDDQPKTYTVDRLLQYRRDHEEWIEKTLRQGTDGRLFTDQPQYKTETIYSTLLPVTRMPLYIFGGPCAIKDGRLLSERMRRLRNGEMAPAILREGKLFTFQNLHDPENPFANLVPTNAVERHPCREWWDDPDRLLWFIDLLNRTLNKLTGRKQVNYDREHKRYYFKPDPVKIERTIRYRPLNQRWKSRQVVWQPKNKRTGQPRGDWYHRAVSLRFHRTGKEAWCLSIRPELHITSDGTTPIPSEEIGSKVTKKKAKTFNYDLLSEVNFWRDFLSESSPRITFRFGPEESSYPSQYLVISTEFMSGSVHWPGIPAEHAKPFKNVEYLDTLFTWAEITQLDSDDHADEWAEELEEVVYWERENDDFTEAE